LDRVQVILLALAGGLLVEAYSQDGGILEVVIPNVEEAVQGIKEVVP
jgi:hypothetical protein